MRFSSSLIIFAPFRRRAGVRSLFRHARYYAADAAALRRYAARYATTPPLRYASSAADAAAITLSMPPCFSRLA